MKLLKNCMLFSLLWIGVNVFAAPSDSAPVAMLKNTTNQMVKALDRHIGKLKNNDKLVDSLVNKILVPHFDLTSMSRSVVGPYWNKSSVDMQNQFKEEFKKYIIRTYSAAMQSYDGEVMRFDPVRGNIGNKVRVGSELMLKNGSPIHLQYSVVNKSGKWLIYDFSVDGISIVKNYNSQFAGILRQGGLDGLVKKLKQRNS